MVIPDDAVSDDLWDRYAGTVLTTGEGLTVAGPGAADLLPFVVPAHVLTAWNPGSVRQSASANAAANRALRQELLRRGLAPTRVVGAAPDGSWHEDSLLVSSLGRQAAVALAARFGQLAIFEVTADELLVLACPHGQERRRVARRAPAQPAVPGWGRAQPAVPGWGRAEHAGG